MKEWWESLQVRERRILALGALLLLVVGFYVLVWEPIHQRHRQLTDQVAEQRAVLGWMEGSAAEARRLRGQGEAAPAQARSGSLLSLIDSRARASGLGDALKRVEPEAGDKVRVWLEEAAFDTVARWLGELQRDYGVSVDSVVLDPKGDAGLVNARIVVGEAAP
jgi:general secretion pathway protein M